LRFKFVSEFNTGQVKNQEGLILNGIYQLLILAYWTSNTTALLVAIKEIGLEVNAERTEYVFMYLEQNALQNYNVNVYVKSLQTETDF
jgi:hypothetical protein